MERKQASIRKNSTWEGICHTQLFPYPPDNLTGRIRNGVQSQGCTGHFRHSGHHFIDHSGRGSGLHVCLGRSLDDMEKSQWATWDAVDQCTASQIAPVYWWAYQNDQRNAKPYAPVCRFRAYTIDLTSVIKGQPIAVRNEIRCCPRSPLDQDFQGLETREEIFARFTKPWRCLGSAACYHWDCDTRHHCPGTRRNGPGRIPEASSGDLAKLYTRTC